MTDRPTPRLSDAQRELLNDFREHEIMYVLHYSRWGQTAQALQRRGLIEVREPDNSGRRNDGWALTDKGRERLDIRD